MKATIADVARAAGVSITTVSRYINGHYESMSEPTRKRLEVVIAQLGYIPNAAAQGLKSGRSRLIGVVLSNVAHVYWSTVLAGIEETCRSKGYSLIISNAADNEELENHYIRMMLTKQVDGILLNPTGQNLEQIKTLPELGCPVVTLSRMVPGLDLDLVATDNAQGATIAVNHLLELGHRRIGMVSWEVQNKSNRRERLEGYLSALTAAGLNHGTEYVVYSNGEWGDGVKQTMALFRRKDRPTAVFSATATLSLEVLAGLRQLGLKVPDDVSVVGYDDALWDPFLDPPLTTIATPAHRLGVLGVKRLVARIEQGTGERPREIRLKPKLLVRGSTRAVQ